MGPWRLSHGYETEGYDGDLVYRSSMGPWRLSHGYASQHACIQRRAYASMGPWRLSHGYVVNLSHRIGNYILQWGRGV